MQARIHGVQIAQLCRRPQALGYGGSARPDPAINIFRRHQLAPHAGFATKNASFFFRRQVCRARGQRIGEVMRRSRVHQIQVVAIGENPSIAAPGGIGEGILAAPRLDHRFFRQRGIENLIPADHYLAVLPHNLLQVAAEVCLQFFITFQTVRAHEFLDLGICVPLLAVHLIAADVEVSVGKKFCHFPNEFIHQFVGAVLSRIHGRIENSPLTFDLIGPGKAGNFRISGEPAGGVAGHVKLRHDADAAVARVFDQFLHFRLRVVQPVGRSLLQLGKALAFHPETLIFGKVPMQHV